MRIQHFLLHRSSCYELYCRWIFRLWSWNWDFAVETKTRNEGQEIDLWHWQCGAIGKTSWHNQNIGTENCRFGTEMRKIEKNLIEFAFPKIGMAVGWIIFTKMLNDLISSYDGNNFALYYIYISTLDFIGLNNKITAVSEINFQKIKNMLSKRAGHNYPPPIK